MRESRFIEQNKEKWQEFEDLFEKRAEQDPDKLSELFIEITNDLSYSQTFYPNRSVKVYLNNLAQKVFHRLYKGKKTSLQKLKDFFLQEQPLVFYAARKDLLISFLVFLLAMLIGIVSTHYNPDFPRIILGDTYVNMTEANIAKGDPMAVYKDQNEGAMFLMITLNNVRVSFMTFAFGIFTSIGTLAILVYNGIMVGTFQFFFFQKGLFLTSFLTIWIHGAIEISAIVVAGGAGITMGRGLLFPKTFSRLEAFQIAAIRGLKIMLGVAPMLIFSGFLEGFVTRHTEAPDWLKASLIALSFLFVFIYVVWYPAKVAKAKGGEPLKDFDPAPKVYNPITYLKPRNLGTVFVDSFEFYRNHIKSISQAILLLVLPLCLLQFLVLLPHFESSLASPSQQGLMGELFRPLQLYVQDFQLVLGLKIDNLFYWVINCVTWTLQSSILLYVFCAAAQQQVDSLVFSWRSLLDFVQKHAVKLFVLVLALKAMLAVSVWAIGLGLLLVPLLFYFLFASCYENLDLLAAGKRSFRFFMQGIFNSWLVVVILLGMLGLISTFLTVPFSFVYAFVSASETNVEANLLDIIFTSIITGMLYLSMPILFIGMGLYYLSIQERLEGIGLKARVAQLGKTSRIYERDGEGYL